MPTADYIYTETTSAGSWDTTSFFDYCNRITETQYAREQQMWAEHQELMDKLDRQAEEEAEDRRKYPLFFWKENI